MEKFDFSEEMLKLLHKSTTPEEAEYLKKSFGISRGKACKGIFLLVSLFDQAVCKGSVPAAREIFDLASNKKTEDNSKLMQLIDELKEGENA